MSSSSGDESETERKGRRKVKLVTNLSGGRPTGGRQVADSDLSSSSFVEDGGDSEEEVKPLKKRRISGGLGGRVDRLGFDKPPCREVLCYLHFFTFYNTEIRVSLEQSITPSYGFRCFIMFSQCSQVLCVCFV